jgi:acyl carrier protein
MTTRREIEDALRDFVANELLHGDADDLEANTNLLALGVIDSLNLVQLRVFMERTFHVRIPDGIQPEDFHTIAAMVAVVARLVGADQARPG